MEKLLILGRGQYSYIIQEIAKDVFDTIDFLDDNLIDSKDVVGKIEDFSKFVKDYEYAIVSIGNSETRLNLTSKLEEAGYKVPVLISKNAYVSQSAEIGVGCVIEPMAVINPNTVLERCCLISAGAVVNHNSIVKEGCHVDCGAIVMSNTIVEKKTKVPYGTIYKN